MTSLLWLHVYTEHSQLVQYFAHSFTTCQVFNTIASYEYTRKINTYSNDTYYFSTYRRSLFKHLLTYAGMSDSTPVIAASVVETTHRQACFHQQHFLIREQTSYNVAIFFVYKWCHSDVIAIKHTALTQN